ncbi:MAG: insulinase family protein [Planctomycetes bacterium]|nr:insulinase family protein [Planctomycetota bacterium]
MALLKMLPEHIPLAPGVDLLFLPEPRLKRALLQVDFDLPLDEGCAARTLLAQVLEQGTAAHPSRMHLAQRQEGLFGATVGFGGLRAAERHRMRLQLGWVGERFLPAGEQVAVEVLGLGRELLERPRRGSGGAPFDETVLERERAQLARHIRSFVDDRAGYAEQRFYEAMCSGEPFARAPWGTVEEVEALTAADLEAVREAILQRGRVLILAVGPVERGSLVEALQAWFGKEGGWVGERAELPEATTRMPEALREVREELPIDQARFHLGFRVARPTNSVEMESLLLASSVLGGGIQGRLFRIVREERSLAYGIGSDVLAGKGLLTVGAGIDASKADEVCEEVLRQVTDLAENGPTEEEISMCKASFLNGLQSIADSAGTLARFYAREFQFGLHRSPADRAAVLESLGPQDVQRAAKSWKADTVFLMADPKASIAGSIG